MASAQAKAVDKKVRMAEESADPNQIVLEPKRQTQGQLAPVRDPDQSDEQFPSAAYSAEEKKDALMAAKLQLQKPGAPGVTDFGVLQAKDSDFEWLRRKREASEYANFSQWFAQNFDKMDVTQKKLAKELFPTFYAERMAQLDRSIALQAKLAKLKLLGIEDKDDLLTQYAVEAGYIDADPLENILHPENAAKKQAAAERQARFGRGLLNPNRLLRGDWGHNRTRKENAEQILGAGRQPNAPYNFGVDGNPFYAGLAPGGGPPTSALGAGWEGKLSAQSQNDFMQQFL